MSQIQLLKNDNNAIQIGELRINPQAYAVTIAGQAIKITPTEYRLLYFLITHPNRVYTRGQLLDTLYPNHWDIDQRTIDAQIKRLRSRLKIKHYDRYIKTLRGFGYQFSFT